MPEISGQWVNRDSGDEYGVIGECKLKMPQRDGWAHGVVYSKGGQLYCCSFIHFTDKFEKIKTPPKLKRLLNEDDPNQVRGKNKYPH